MKWTLEAIDSLTVFNLGNLKIQTLHLKVSSGIKHGFCLPFDPSFLPLTHELLIGSEYGEF